MSGAKKYRVKKKIAAKKNKKKRKNLNPRQKQHERIFNPRRIVPEAKLIQKELPPMRKKTRKRIATEAERKKKYKTSQYKERAKRLRPFFKGQFAAGEGFDLRKPDSWTPAQKAKVTKYFRVMAPHITGDFVTKRYRNKENEQAAFDASLQEHRLKGQTGIAFKLSDPNEKLEIVVKRGKATIKQSGVTRVKIKFNRERFLADPDAEIDRALATTKANAFRLITGGSTQLKRLTRSDVKLELMALIKQYAPTRVRYEQGQRSYDDWLNGLIAYEGSAKKTATAIDKFIKRQERVSAVNEIERLDTLSKKGGGKGYNKTIVEQIEIRRKRKQK